MNREIKIENVLIYYDVPQLFIGADLIGTKYICLLFDDSDNFKYLTIEVSDERLRVFLSGKLDLRELYLKPEIKGEYFQTESIDNGFYLLPLKSDLNEDMLPEEGLFYEDIGDDSLIIAETIERKHPVIHLGFEDFNNSPTIELPVLSILSAHYQSLFSNCYKKTGGSSKDKDHTLRAFNATAASFNLHVYAESDLDMFGMSRIEQTMQAIDGLFDFENENELRERLEPLKGHTVKSYKNFVKCLIDNKINFKYKRVVSISDPIVVKNKIKLPALNNIYKVLEESNELSKEIKVIKGYFIAISLVSGNWSIIDEDDKKVNGTTDDLSLLSGITTKSVAYTLTCEEILEQDNVSAKERTVYKLIRIEK